MVEEGKLYYNLTGLLNTEMEGRVIEDKIM